MCPLAHKLKCAGCAYSWESDDVNVPEPCPSCGQNASVAERCESCPVVVVEHYREMTATGALLDRVLEHEFDTKHYHVDPGGVSADVREGLKVLGGERARWEKEEREETQREFDEKRRINEMQRKAGRF